MMSQLAVLMTGALACAPLFSQNLAAADPRIHAGEVVWFRLKETRDQVGRLLGAPALTADFGRDFLSWQYRIGDIDHDEFSLHVVFRKSENVLISVTRNYESERNVDTMFPPSETTAYYYPRTGKLLYSLRLRHLPGGRVLMAMGTSTLGQPTSQLVLMRETELRYFYPWLYEQLRDEHAQPPGPRGKRQ
jgi:hypothetical protein